MAHDHQRAAEFLLLPRGKDDNFENSSESNPDNNSENNSENNLDNNLDDNSDSNSENNSNNNSDNNADEYCTSNDFTELVKLAENSSGTSVGEATKILLPLLPKEKKQLELESTRKPEFKDVSLAEMGYDVKNYKGWENVYHRRRQDLYKSLFKMVTKHIKPNIQIRLSGMTFRCHNMVLQSYSGFFVELGNKSLIEIPEECVTPTAFIMIYNWMLSDRPLIQRKGIIDLFKAAHFLKITELVNQIWVCLDNSKHFIEHRAFLAYLEARICNVRLLQDLMLTRVSKFFLTLVASKEFVELPSKEVCSLLKSNAIGVNSEIEVFYTIVRWLSYDWDKREEEMINLMQYVRFGVMPPWFLVKLLHVGDCVEVNAVIQNPVINKQLNNGVAYHTVRPYWQKNRKLVTYIEGYDYSPQQRQWIFDENCKYHFHFGDTDMREVNYEDFLEYLVEIQFRGKDYERPLVKVRSNALDSCI